MAALSPTNPASAWVQVDGVWQYPMASGEDYRLRQEGEARWVVETRELIATRGTRRPAVWTQIGGLVFDDLASGKAEIEAISLHQQERAALGRRDIPLSSHRPEGTPWGVAQTKVGYAEGVTFYSTADHGGFCVDTVRLAAMPPHLRNEDGWFEEDIGWSLVATAFPELFTGYERKHAEAILRNSFPEVWEKQHGRPLEEGQSRRRDEELFLIRHAGDWLAQSVATLDVEKGLLEVAATIGGHLKGEKKQFCVSEADYAARSPFGFIVDPTRHAEIVKANPFFAKDGKLTAYAFACGYVEKTELDRDNRLTLMQEHHTYHLKGFVGGAHLWESFDTLQQARKGFQAAESRFSPEVLRDSVTLDAEASR